MPVARIQRAIRAIGPLLEVRIGISDGLRQQLWRRGMSPPPPVYATFLIDTGSDSSMVDEQITLSLGINAINQRKVLTSESKGVPQLCNVYDISVEVPNQDGSPWRIATLHANGRHLISDSIQGVLGRDVLDQVVLIYDGPTGVFRIEYRSSGAAAESHETT